MSAGGIVLLVFAILAVVVAIVLLFQGVRTVPQGWEWTVEKFGQYTRTLRPGLNFMFPVVERVGARINMQESVLDIPQQQVITKDNAIVSVDGVAFYQVVDARAAAYEVRNLVQAITNLALTNIRNVMGSLALDDLLAKRNEINDRLLSVIDHATSAWGIKVLRIELKDIIPPQDMVQAMARQMKAERDKRAQILEAEGTREAQIKRAEGEKQAQILQAEGRREAAFRDAEARERAAEAEAKATQVVTAAIGSGGGQAINYFLGQKYVDALHAMGSSNNSKVFFLPIEATGIMGTLGGLAELTRESARSAAAATATRVGAIAATALPSPAAPGGGDGAPVPPGPWNRG
ncbi:MAG TPA: SPFH domain-containing protein [Vineibacter sp.]|nr:SPFH domain-containing protein [Vineibacter sp.]